MVMGDPTAAIWGGGEHFRNASAGLRNAGPKFRGRSSVRCEPRAVAWSAQHYGPPGRGPH
jgi:hypothetical protein